MDLLTPGLNRLLDTWLDEDLGRGDLTSVALKNLEGSAYWIAKAEGTFCGGPFVEQLFKKVNQEVQIELLVKDGEPVLTNQRVLELHGPASALVAGERTALNLAMRLSGIASATAELVKQLERTNVRLADTRKTTPGMRLLEKYAIRCGGGVNHRLGLDDAAMLKENHIAWAGGIQTAIDAVKASAPWTSKVIVEAETANQAKEAVLAGADGVLLDEFSPEELKLLIPKLRELAKSRSCPYTSKEIVIEASGIRTDELKAFAATGVDLISTSAPITRSSWLDLSMRFDQFK
ncbi:carboxylating nicotinate-nucleotide diphosphorylase [Prochlorococcus sp. MIT 1300]|uniref:carboxylating nicotinate-nucleotide diphosphorylase n=1 Tax=Prochlorococcus sp. MIT 1300 TaxID=3096218 RepID=UPI002A761DE4|nr:carboxylating nicotinate-nucleotide diphosphorylase [Prochlorococcus sp. MIT 1300]